MAVPRGPAGAEPDGRLDHEDPADRGRSLPELQFRQIWSETPAYFLHSFLQEPVEREYIQSPIQRFLNDRRGVKTVLLTSIMFGIFHVHFGPPAIAVTIANCIVFDLSHLRRQNFAVVTLLHLTRGACAFSIEIP